MRSKLQTEKLVQLGSSIRERIYLEILDTDLAKRIGTIIAESAQNQTLELLNDSEREHVLSLLSIRGKIAAVLKGFPRTCNN